MQTCELLVLQARDPPRELLLVGQLDAEATTSRGGEHVPVVVERGVDVDCDPHAADPYRRDMTLVGLPPSDRRPRRLRAAGPVAVAGHRLERAPALDHAGRAARERHRHRPEDSDHAPLVFIHGLSGCWQNWLENIPLFARTRRVIALDLPGLRALADAGRGHLDHRATPRLVDELLGLLEIEAACVVGNSMGGFTGRRARDPLPAARRAPRPRLRRRDQHRRHAQRAVRWRHCAAPNSWSRWAPA